jgi:hypothetical protein
MKKRMERRDPPDALRQEYDLSKLKVGVRGKYVARSKRAPKLALLSPDVAEYFPNKQSVYAVLRTLIHVAKGPVRRARQTPIKTRQLCAFRAGGNIW